MAGEHVLWKGLFSVNVLKFKATEKGQKAITVYDVKFMIQNVCC